MTRDGAPGGGSSGDVRELLYQTYATARRVPLAPASLAGLEARRPYLERLVRQHVPADRDVTILDLGCGHGALLHVLQQMGYAHAMGIDRSADQVAAAQRLGIAGVRQGTWADVLAGRESGTLDVAIAFDLVEHLTREEAVALLRETHRVLRSSGRIILHTVNAESPLFGRVRYGDITHELAFTRQSLDQLLTTVGFGTLRFFEDAPTVHGVRSAARWLLWHGFRSVLRLYVAAETGSLGRNSIFSQNLLCVATK